ncbi:MAG: 4Fe-4S binding protein [Desulfopila sp.]
MQEIVVVSGKGGTGKTSLTATFAMLAHNSVLCDADVDAADLHLLLDPRIERRHDFMGGGLAVIDRDRCNECRTCRRLCRFDAISEDYVVDPISCEGCGVCVDLCPEKAIDFPIQKCGEWFVSTSRGGPMVHARLGIGEENSGKLVSLVRRQARDLAKSRELELIITDGPPGIGCPVIAAISGATMLVLVVEPSMSGLHDLDRVVRLAEHFRVPAQVIINKYDLNLAMTAEIEGWTVERNLRLLGRVPFDPLFVETMVAGKTVVELAARTTTADIVREIWQRIGHALTINGAREKGFPIALHTNQEM